MKNLATKFENLTIQNDFIFKKVMSRKRICIHLLEELLQIKIADINYLEAEKSLEPEYTSRGIRLDIIVADDRNTHYNLEMQVKNPVSRTGKFQLPKRTRYYQAMLDTDMLQKGQDYDELSPTYIIFFCLFDFFEDSQRIYTFKRRCLENMEIELADEAAIMFLNTLGTKGDVSPDIQSLFDYINSNTVTSNFTREVADTITEIKNDKKVRDSYMTYEMRMKDIREESLAEGEAKGEAKEKLRVAKLMLTKGCYSLQEISELTKLSIEDIEKLEKEMHATE